MTYRMDGVLFMAEKKLKRWELALIFGVVFALLWGFWVDEEQQELADQVIRFHVLANSDSPEDQELKLKVRDEVLACAQSVYPENADLEQARQALTAHLEDLAQAGQSVVEAEGYDYSVTAAMESCWFPTKSYQDFSLPAGEYTALRVVIGEGEGANWWCVAFPPLCLGAASQTLETATEAGWFSPDQVALVTEENEGYVLKFKSMELLGMAKELLLGGEKS